MAADSFQGGVRQARAGREELRARVAIHGSNIEALTGDETFRIPIASCSLSREGAIVAVRDQAGSLVIWSEDDAFLDALERAQRGTLKEQVASIRGTRRRLRFLKGGAKALLAAAVLLGASVPFLRWALRGGIPALSDRVGQSALERLALPSGVAPTAETRLAVLADKLRPQVSPSHRSFRVLLANYADIHSFDLPPDTIVITSGLVCAAADPDLVMEAIAIELAHLENRDVSNRVAEAVEWNTPIAFLYGDVSALSDRMLDFADPKRSPGFTEAQDDAAGERALSLLRSAGSSIQSTKELAERAERLAEVHLGANEAQPTAAGDDGLDWQKARAEACDVIGH